MNISKEAIEAAEIFFDCHPDSLRWDSEVKDLASRFDAFAAARTEAAEKRITELEQMIMAFHNKALDYSSPVSHV